VVAAPSAAEGVAAAAAAVTLWSKCANSKNYLKRQPPGHMFELSFDDHRAKC